MTAPLGYNALLQSICPWVSFLRSLTSVTTSATAIPSTALSNRAGIWLFNSGTANVFLGDINVGTSNEMILFPNQTLLFPVSDQVILYGRVASGSVNVVTFEYRI